MAQDKEAPVPKKRQRKEQRDEAIAEYKELTRAAKNVARNEDPRKVLELVARDMRRSRALYPLVSKKLDGTSADARHAKEITTLGKETANHINVTQRHIEIWKQLLYLKRDIEVETGTLPDRKQLIDWCAENYASSCMFRPPTFEYFYGAINEQDLEIKERKVRGPRERDTATQATTAKEKDIEVDVEQDQTPKEVEHINRQIRRLSVSRRKTNLPFFATVVDPHSFVRTVENIFHASFLVKEGKIGVKPDSEEKVPVLTIEENQSQTAADENQQQESLILHGNQSILSFSVEDHRRWISQYNLKESAFPPRGDSDNENENDAGDD